MTHATRARLFFQNFFSCSPPFGWEIQCALRVTPAAESHSLYSNIIKGGIFDAWFGEILRSPHQQQENANCRKAFLKQVSKRHSNLTKWLCTSWKLGASYIVINRKLFKFFAVSKMKLLVEFSIVQPSIRMARLATFLKVGLVWRKFTFAIFTIISLVFLAK